MRDDPIVAEVRRIREEIAARFDFDVRALAEDLKQQEKEGQRPLVIPPDREPPPVARED